VLPSPHHCPLAPTVLPGVMQHGVVAVENTQRLDLLTQEAKSGCCCTRWQCPGGTGAGGPSVHILVSSSHKLCLPFVIVQCTISETCLIGDVIRRQWHCRRLNDSRCRQRSRRSPLRRGNPLVFAPEETCEGAAEAAHECDDGADESNESR
jgi:hypothetical protein